MFYTRAQVKFDAMELVEIRAQWNQVLDALESTNRVAWIAYFDARLSSYENGVLTLDFSDSRKFATSHEYSETRPNLKSALIEAIRSTLGITVEISEQ
ncbi:MAG: hypothetical protein WCN84_04415 [Actinomycetes bacterium]